MGLIDIAKVEEMLPVLTDQWKDTSLRGTSFVVIDRLVDRDREWKVFEDFPAAEWPEWQRIGDILQSKKLSSEEIEQFPPILATLVHELHSGPMIRILEKLSGVVGLLPDPHLRGGGLHMTEPGGYLWPHTDFLEVKHSRLIRTLNLVYFAHSAWGVEAGGHFQIWRKKEVAVSIPPRPGRCIIFRTDSSSVHGVSQTSTRDNRKSVALFYYTVDERRFGMQDPTTGWRLALQPTGASIGLVRRAVAVSLIHASVALKRLAIASNRQAEHLMIRKGRARLRRSGL